MLCTPGDFTTDGIDEGGLSKHFSSLLARGFKTSGQRKAFVRLWDPDARPQVFHLNFEATGEAGEADDFRKAGSLLALIFLRQLPFLRLSRALIQFLLGHEAALTMDLEEVRFLRPENCSAAMTLG